MVFCSSVALLFSPLCRWWLRKNSLPEPRLWGRSSGIPIPRTCGWHSPSLHACDVCIAIPFCVLVTTWVLDSFPTCVTTISPQQGCTSFLLPFRNKAQVLNICQLALQLFLSSSVSSHLFYFSDKPYPNSAFWSIYKVPFFCSVTQSFNRKAFQGPVWNGLLQQNNTQWFMGPLSEQ